MFYAVKEGRAPGIYTSWDECKNQTHGYSGAIFHKFKTKDEALEFMKKNPIKEITNKILSWDNLDPHVAHCFVDGSYNPKTAVFGWGGFVLLEGKKTIIQGSNNDPSIASMRNVAGELSGAMEAVKVSLSLGTQSIILYYDYLGIEKWVTGEWGSSIPWIVDYIQWMREASKNCKIHFEKIKAHTGVDGNEEADSLAKEAVGV